MVLVADADGLTPLKDYNSLWKALPNNIKKIAGRRTTVDMAICWFMAMVT